MYFVQEIVLVVYTCTSGFYIHVHQGFIHMYIRVLYTCTCIFIDKFHVSLTQLPIHQQHQCMEFITGTAYTSLTLDFTSVFFLVGSDFIFLCCVFCFVYEYTLYKTREIQPYSYIGRVYVQ